MRRSVVGAAVVAVALTVAGCSDDGGRSPGSAGPSSGSTGRVESSEPAAPTTDATMTTQVDAGPVALAVAAPGAATISPAGSDDAQQLLLPLPATITLTSGGSFTRNADGTVTVRDAGGTAVGGLSAPVAADSRVTLSVVEPTVLSVDASSGATGAPGPSGQAAARAGQAAAGSGECCLFARVLPIDRQHSTPKGSTQFVLAQSVQATLTLGTTGLRSATWGVYDGGRSLAVDPTDWARHGGMAALDTAWAQLVTAQPEADTTGMHDQFTCHAIGAPDKTTWNLEPWRPDVGLAATLAAKCNPS